MNRLLLPNLIIGGAQKAGTTSLFRYLSDHPSIFPSSIKETNIFLKYIDSKEKINLDRYREYFRGCKNHSLLRIEANPRYLMKGETIAKSIYKYLPDVKLLFILREPISLLVSYIKWKSNQTGKKRSLTQIINVIEKKSKGAFSSEENVSETSAFIRLQAGCYATFLMHFFKHFPKQNIGIFFYDDLANNPRLLMKKICTFLKIDDNHYKDYFFNIENRSRYYKYPKIHKMAVLINSKMEKPLNQYPTIRRGLRKGYNKICERNEYRDKLSSDTKARLEEFYAIYNRELYYLLKKKYPYLELPSWLDIS
jgi:hypothetical protein